MEDEYICVDDLHERLGGAPIFPSPGAFYGVPYFYSALLIRKWKALSKKSIVEFCGFINFHKSTVGK